MPDFLIDLDIADRAHQHVGVRRMQPAGITNDTLWAASTELADSESYFLYDKCRRAELQRNLWSYATQRTVLRAIDTTTLLLTFTDTTVIYNQTANLWNDTQTPGSTENVEYFLNEYVYTTPGDGTYTIYKSLINDNGFNPADVDPWNAALQYSDGQVVSYNGNNYLGLIGLNFNFEPDISPLAWANVTTIPVYNPATTYSIGQVVSYLSINYQSLINSNLNNEPDISPSDWAAFTLPSLVSNSWEPSPGEISSSAPFSLPYPIGTGPASNPSNNNVYMVPQGFLRVAPPNPKEGATAWMGAHKGLSPDTTIFESGFISGPTYQTTLFLRFVGNITLVTQMHPMFCEGLAARIGMEMAPRLDPTKQQACIVAYNRAMGEARTVDAIEQGPVEQEEDEYLTVRL